jgi:hypothetical protein
VLALNLHLAKFKPTGPLYRHSRLIEQGSLLLLHPLNALPAAQLIGGAGLFEG